MTDTHTAWCHRLHLNSIVCKISLKLNLHLRTDYLRENLLNYLKSTVVCLKANKMVKPTLGLQVVKCQKNTKQGQCTHTHTHCFMAIFQRVSQYRLISLVPLQIRLVPQRSPKGERSPTGEPLGFVGAVHTNIETVSCPCNTCFWYARALAVRNTSWGAAEWRRSYSRRESLSKTRIAWARDHFNFYC